MDRCYACHAMTTVRRWRSALRFLAASTLPLLALVALVSHAQTAEKAQRQPYRASTPAIKAPTPPPVVSYPVEAAKPRKKGEGVVGSSRARSAPTRGSGVSPAQRLVTGRVRLEIPVEVSVQCEVDRDCVLIDQRLGLACCWAGVCNSIDYSQGSYIAVNEASFEASREEHCPPDTEGYAPEALTQKTRGCGPMPGCPVPPATNDRFAATCIEGFCEKVPE